MSGRVDVWIDPRTDYLSRFTYSTGPGTQMRMGAAHLHSTSSSIPGKTQPLDVGDEDWELIRSIYSSMPEKVPMPSMQFKDLTMTLSRFDDPTITVPEP